MCHKFKVKFPSEKNSYENSKLCEIFALTRLPGVPFPIKANICMTVLF